jgi:hypothetical protein
MRLLLVICTVVLFGIAWCSVVSAQELDVIFTAFGDVYAEDMGYGVQSPGDLNGNGFSEVFVFSWGGRSVKVFDGGDPASEEPIKSYSGIIGRSAWSGDINRDGLKDFVCNNKLYGETGQIEIYYGGENFYAKTEPDLIIYPNQDELGFAHEFEFADYNGDSHLDIIFKAYSTDYPIEARFYFFETYPVLDSIADDTLTLWYDVSGWAFEAHCIGDINGDSYADYATAQIGALPKSSVKVFFGSDPLNSIPDLQIWSPFEEGPGGGEFGRSIVPVGDLNWDNYADFIVTSSGTWPPCIFYGGNPFDTIPKILEHPGDVADLCGDINGDGWDDIAVGYTHWDFGYGLLRVYYGALDMDTIADLTIWHPEVPSPLYHFGQSVGSAGDFNGGGVDDLVVGAHDFDIPEWNKGRIYVFAGDSTLPTDADDVETGDILPESHDILHQNYPNPFNSETLIEYTLCGHAGRRVMIAVYNILGQRIALLKDCTESRGSHNVTWDGTDDLGNSVPSGVYFYVLRSSGQTQTRKMLFLK